MYYHMIFYYCCYVSSSHLYHLSFGWYLIHCFEIWIEGIDKIGSFSSLLFSVITCLATKYNYFFIISNSRMPSQRRKIPLCLNLLPFNTHSILHDLVAYGAINTAYKENTFSNWINSRSFSSRRSPFMPFQLFLPVCYNFSRFQPDHLIWY